MKNPLFELKYVEGLGDLLRVFLHSRYIKPILILVRGNDNYCLTCSQRAYALNILFPIKVWKFYFKDYETFQKSFSDDAEKFGRNIVQDENIKTPTEDTLNENHEQPVFDFNQIKYDGFEFMQQSEYNYDHIRIVTSVFKRKD